jgi:hypothetical protein
MKTQATSVLLVHEALSYYVSSYYHMCVLLLLYVCPHTTMCPHTTIYVFAYYYICVLILLYMCPHTTILLVPFFFFQKAMGERNCSGARSDKTQTALFVALLAAAFAFTVPAPYATHHMSFVTSPAMLHALSLYAQYHYHSVHGRR